MNNQQTSPSHAEIVDSLKELSPHKLALGGKFELEINYYMDGTNLSCSFSGATLTQPVELSKHLVLTPAGDGGRCTLSCALPGLEIEFSAFLALLLEKIRLGSPPSEAIYEQLDSWKLLAAGPEQVDSLGVIGLYGELWMALQLAKIGAGIDTWTALQASVFDFSHNTIEIEVKTTTKPNHIHRISRPDQLLASIGANSWLLSVMAARVGNSSGNSLGVMIKLLAGLGWEKDLIDAHVKRLNLGPIERVLDYTFKLREQPMWVRGSSLPLVTPEALRSLIGPAVVRLSRFEYIFTSELLTDTSALMLWRSLIA
jgi:hypothetical protein